MNKFIIPRDRDKLIWFLDRLDPNMDWQVDVKRFRETRTRKQENTLWGVVYPQIITFVGGAITKVDVHDAMRDEFPIRSKENPITKKHSPVSSTELDSSEYAQYLELVMAFWAERGLFIAIESEAR